MTRASEPFPVRYFAATALAGRLHVDNVPRWRPWDPSRLRFEDEAYVDLVTEGMMRMLKKITTLGELRAVLGRTRSHPGSVSLYVHEGLLDEAKRWWEEARADFQRRDAAPGEGILR